MSRFKIGQDLVCLGGFKYVDGNDIPLDKREYPNKNETSKVIRVMYYEGKWLVEIGGYDGFFNQRNFAPLFDDGSTKSLTKEIIEEGVLEQLKLEEIELN